MPELGRFIPGFLKRNEPTPTNLPETSISGITPEVAKADIEKALRGFSTLGVGTDIDRAAQMILQSLQVLSRRLDRPPVLRMLYLDRPEAGQMLPEVALETVTKLCNDEITPDQAKQTLDEAISAYTKVFEDMGVRPAKISGLFSKPTK